MSGSRPHLLPPVPDVPNELARKVGEDHERFARDGLPRDLELYLRETYHLDMTASYAGMLLRNPWGKASGQLSLNVAQLEEAAADGLGFVVLKTVIAQDASGRQAMGAWAIKESKMVAEPIESPLTGARGWTITWRGRGWWQTFAEFLALVKQGVALARAHAMPVIPRSSTTFPARARPTGARKNTGYTTGEPPAGLGGRRRESAHAAGEGLLAHARGLRPCRAAGHRDRLAASRARSRSARRHPARCCLGLKLFNALDDDAFQLASCWPRGP